MKQIKEGTLKTIKKQLGREPDNLFSVARECPFGKPAVLLVKPFKEKGKIFPTIYWLSCPYLVKNVARLEDEGLIKDLTLRLDRGGDLKEKMGQAHNKYAVERMSLLDKNDCRVINKISPDILEMLKKSGVGGIREKDGLKCLHAHLADYMVSGENPIGRIVSERLTWPDSCHICRDLTGE